MPVVHMTRSINAPVGRVFDIVTTPSNWTRYVTSLVDVKDLSPDMPKRGATFRWEYKMFGVRFKGKGVVTGHVRNKSFGLSLKGKFPIEESYDFIDKGGSTDLTVKIEYAMPGKILSMVPDKLIEKLNSIEARGVLDKIKTLCEEKS
ncbi:MAG: SRPBCC family protein [Thermodesulfovibrionales bacterium]|nr:SRPBCC family protein [Thermodesulfovibrionales bacterium]